MTFNPADYHPDWRSISRQIKDQADWVCEFCGAAHGAAFVRMDFGDGPVRVFIARDDQRELCERASVPIKRIVLTVAHLNHETQDNDPCNLRALCQACHNRWDAPHRAKNAAQTRRRRRIAATGQRELLAAPATGEGGR